MSASRVRSAWRTVVVVGIGIALEAEAMKHGKHEETYSSVTRTVFSTDETYGKVAFVLCLTAGYIWYTGHILRGPER